ncbi:unnamed protein product [Hapterophycus canaliculatus]
MPVEEAWGLLDALSAQVVGKQTELQLMVGSRYHELIESADSIVSMKETGSEVLGLLRNFPQECSSVLEQVPSSPSSRTSKIDGFDTVKKRGARGVSEVVQLMLHAPAAMWAALDSNKVLEAANLVLKCRSSWASLSSSFSVDVDYSVAAFLRSHATYVEQFPRRILLAATRLVTRSCNARETAGALTALLQLQAIKDANPLRYLLELLLRRRGGAIVAMLTRASKVEGSIHVERVLRIAIATVQRTIIDVHALFAPRPDGSCMLQDLVHPSCCVRRTLTLSAHDSKGMCTKWLSILAPKIRALSERLLRATGDTNTLAQIRGALWELTHGEGTSTRSAPGAGAVVRQKAAEEAQWTEAASFAVDVSAVGYGKQARLSVSSAPLDLWSLLFSQIFTDLAEALLKESLFCIRKDVECRLDSILLSITGNEPQPRASTTLDTLAASDTVVSLLASEIRDLAGDASCLAERGDEPAADALKTSFYLLCVDMAAGLANHFRIALQEIHSRIKSVAQENGQGLPCGDGVGGAQDAVGRFADAGLVIGRVASMLNSQSGRPLRFALTPPACFASRMRGHIEEQQLEAAFIIADTDGDGIVDAEEAAEALEAVSFGASVALVLDPSLYPSFTLSEFFLFAARLLEEQRPHQHLDSCLDTLLAESLAMWAEYSLRKPAKLLSEGCKVFGSLCSKPGITDELWRETHGIWEDKTIELDRDDGDGIQETMHFPVMISPAILCYIKGIAAELSRILSTADLAEPVTTEAPRSVGHAAGDSTSDNGAGEGAAGYARSLAAVRASNDLLHVLVVLCEDRNSPAAHGCEAAQLQLLLDALFLQRWISDTQGSTSSMDSVVATLCERIDPINLQIYMPHLQMAASSCWAACHTSLSLIFEVVAPGSLPSTNSMSPDGALGSSSSFVTLAPKARRFEILPLSLDLVRLQHLNGVSRAGQSSGHKSLDSVSEEGASAQTRGLEAGRQALAGLMGQVGSVGSVLSAQNVHVQSVFGAASLFLGGRNRRGDEDEDVY